MVSYRTLRLYLDRSLLWGILLAASILFGSLYLTFGTEWGWDTQFFRWVAGLSILLFVALVATRRYRLLLPAGLVSLGVLVFWVGTAGGMCVQPTVPENSVWSLEYNWRSNTIYFGWSGGPFGGYFCMGQPNRLVAVLGYLCCAAGITGVVRTRSETS